MKKRGLSPVIATVLLIGIVVVTGLIIFMWFRGLTQEAITKFDQNIQLVCDDVDFVASYQSGSLAVSNIGNIPIFGMKVMINSGGGGFETQDIIDLAPTWPGTGLNQGKAFSSSVSGIGGSVTSIKLIPVLRGIKQSGAESSFVCDENYGREISL